MTQTGHEVSFAARAPNWLGDAVLAAPAVAGIVDCSRRGRVVVLTSASGREVYSRLPGTLVFSVRQAGGSHLDSLRAVFSGSSVLRSFRPVVVFSFTRSLTSAVTCFLGRVPRRVGFADSALPQLYTDRVGRARTDGRHLIDAYCGLVESMGIRVADRVPRLRPTADDQQRGERVLKTHDLPRSRYICLFPGARYGPAKRWEASRFGLLGDILIDRLQQDIVLLGTKEDTAACTAVQEAMHTKCLNLCGKLDFADLVGLLTNARAAVSNDSGGMHLAAGLGIPTVGLFFSSDPSWTGPVAAGSRSLYNRIDCSPCFSRDCKRDHVCTSSITVDEVTAALEEVTDLG